MNQTKTKPKQASVPTDRHWYRLYRILYNSASLGLHNMQAHSIGLGSYCIENAFYGVKRGVAIAFHNPV